MTLRTAVRQSKVLAFVVLGAFIWLLFTLLETASTLDMSTGTTSFVGQNALGGIAGVLTMALLLGALVVLYAELSESDPAPESWPPSE